MKIWEPSDIRKVIVQVFGICLSIGGINLLTTSSKIESSTVIKFNFKEIGTELHTSQVGLVLIFLGFMLVLIPSLSFRKQASINPGTKNTSLIYAAITALIFIIIVAGIFMFLNYMKATDGVYALVTAFIALILVGLGVYTLIEKGQM